MRAPFIIFMCFSWLSGCSQKGASSRDPLAEEIWQRMIADENRAQYSEVLEPDLLSEHKRNMESLRGLIPEGFPEPFLPYGRLRDPSIDFSLSRRPFLNADIIVLGESLFNDRRLSFSSRHGGPGDISCASCHQEEKAFSDNEPVSHGVDGDATFRNSPTLINSAFNSTLTWGNPAFPALEMQARIPMFGDDPVEMGLMGREKKLFDELLADDPGLRQQFQKVFHLVHPEDRDRMDYTLITAALAAYERSLIRFDSKFDRFLQGLPGTAESMSDEERAGIRLFYGIDTLESGARLPCAQCHAGFLLSDSFHYVREGRYVNNKAFHNTGLYNLDGRGAYPEKNTGYASTEELAENPGLMGRFRTPPLRFVSNTFPYGHDGSLKNLEDVIRHYAVGGRASLGPNGQNPFVDERIKSGFAISDEEVQILLAFLNTLR